jgi:hypothetical protein
MRRRSPNKINRSRHSSRIDRTNRSAWALAFGAWNGVRTTRTPAPSRRPRNPAVHLPSRSQISTLWPVRNPSTASARRRAPVRPQEGTPRRWPTWRRQDPIVSQHLGDRASRDMVVEVLQRALDPAVAPAWILCRHPHNERRDLLHEPRTPWAPALECPLLSDQPPVPSQNRVGRHDRCHLLQHPATESLAPRRQPPALGVSQPNSPASQLLLENAILLHQIVDHLLLAAVDPSSQGDEQQPQG